MTAKLIYDYDADTTTNFYATQTTATPSWTVTDTMSAEVIDAAGAQTIHIGNGGFLQLESTVGANTIVFDVLNASQLSVYLDGTDAVFKYGAYDVARITASTDTQTILFYDGSSAALTYDGASTITLNGVALTTSPATATATAFTVNENAGVVTFSGPATGDITMAITDGTATFTRGGTPASTSVADIAAKMIQVDAGQTFSTTADLANGLTITGAGTVAITSLEVTPSADLSGIDAGTITATLATNNASPVDFVGNFGSADVTVTGNGTLVVGMATMGYATFNIGAGATLAGPASILSGVSASGTGSVEVTMLENGTDLSGLATSLQVLALTQGAGVNVDISSNTKLSTVDIFHASSTDTLVMTAAQASNKLIIGDGALTVKALDATPSADLNNLNDALTVNALIEGTADISANATLGKVDTFTVATGAVATLSVTQAEKNITLDGAGAVAKVKVNTTSDISGLTLDSHISQIDVADNAAVTLNLAQAGQLGTIGTGASYSLAATLADLQAAAPGVVSGAHSYTLTDDVSSITTLNVAQATVLEGATNVGTYSFTVVDNAAAFTGTLALVGALSISINQLTFSTATDTITNGTDDFIIGNYMGGVNSGLVDATGEWTFDNSSHTLVFWNGTSAEQVILTGVSTVAANNTDTFALTFA